MKPRPLTKKMDTIVTNAYTHTHTHKIIIIINFKNFHMFEVYGVVLRGKP